MPEISPTNTTDEKNSDRTGQEETPDTSAKEKPARLCKECGERPTIQPNSPYCAVCLNAMQKAAREAKNKGSGGDKGKKKGNDKPKPEKPQETADTAITIEFGQYVDILRAVESMAKEEMRPVDMQIIYILKKYFDSHQ